MAYRIAAADVIAATYLSSIANCLKKSCSATPMGLLKKHARCRSIPVSRRR